VPDPRRQWEIAVGAILTQNTTWHNASLALSELARQRHLSLRRMAALPHADLAATIRPAGYYNQKARHLLELARHVAEAWGGRIARFLSQPPADLRHQLLQRRGIGPETADSILLYAAGYPFFVVDTYTRRIGVRLGWVQEGIAYDLLQGYFASRLPSDPALYNEYHALLVRHAVVHCKAIPVCEACRLRDACRHAGRPNDSSSRSGGTP
jgi:endonuclease-3 related protein